MDDDFPLLYPTVKAGAELRPDNVRVDYTQVTFYLGTHGPFVERFTSPNWDAELKQRAELLRSKLRGISK